MSFLAREACRPASPRIAAEPRFAPEGRGVGVACSIWQRRVTVRLLPQPLPPGQHECNEAPEA
jgi:hypothetical protein